MKKMLHYHIMGAVMLLSLSSCALYQVNTLSSPNMVHDEKKSALVLENDSLRISYSFTPERRSHMTIEVFNKLDKPLLIDWQRSALAYSGGSTPYTSNKVDFDGTSQRTIDLIPINREYQTREMSGQITLPTYTRFIPPHTAVTSIPILLPDMPLSVIQDSSFRDIQLTQLAQVSAEHVKGQKAIFTGNNSPLSFVSYLTIKDNETNASVVTYAHRFFASEIVQTKAQPENTYYLAEQPGIRFYLKGSTQTTKNQ